MDIRKVLTGILVAAVLLISIGCNHNRDAVGLNGNIAGLWKFSSGDSFASLYVSDLQYMHFNPDGTGMIYYKDDFGVLANNAFFYAVLNESAVTIDFGTGGTRSLHVAGSPPSPRQPIGIFGFPGSGQTVMGTYVKDEETSTLTLTDTGGDAIELSYTEGEVPEELLMGELTVQGEYTDLEIEPEHHTGLVYDGTSLWFEEYVTDTIYPFDPVSEILNSGSAVDLSAADPYTHIKSFQDGHFWTHSASGGDEDVQRIDPTSPGTPVDTIDTDTDLGNKLNMDAMAWDGSHLWLSGSNEEDIYQLLKVDSDSEPDDLVQTYEFVSLDSLTADGTDFWALYPYLGNAVIKFTVDDSAGVTVQSSYILPRQDISWKGIDVVGTDLYLLAENSEEAAVIYKVTPTDPASTE